MADIIPESEITIDRLKDIFSSAYLRTDIDSDGDLVVREEGVNAFIDIDSNRKIISYYSIWGLKESADELSKLQFVNRLNDSLVLVRFSVTGSARMYCDYQFIYEGGIAPWFLVYNLKRFISICKGVSQKDSDEVMG